VQYVEIMTFFEGYLLHSQGDRMLMGHSIEGRFPFVDYRLAEFAARLPDRLRVRGLEEKHALRRAAARHLPREVFARPKVPYRAPIREVFFGTRTAAATLELLGSRRLREAELLDERALERLVAKFQAPNSTVSETDEMALAGSVSLAVLHERLVASPSLAPAEEPARVVVGGEVVAPQAPIAEVV
jgi:asparagine synthase (glutamine-hydrolysing)